nr:hypothetical protein [Thermofilum adornatum]
MESHVSEKNELKVGSPAHDGAQVIDDVSEKNELKDRYVFAQLHKGYPAVVLVSETNELKDYFLESLGSRIFCGRLLRLVLILATSGGSTTSRLLVGRTA